MSSERAGKSGAKTDRVLKRELGPKVVVAEFTFAAAISTHLPPGTLPEVAFGGRSNVGKSSLLNALLERKSLVRTSKNPGCTRQINLFRTVTQSTKDAPTNELFVVDLPGYGFASRSKTERVQWGTLIESYLTKRETLRALVLLVDVRRGVEEDDRQLIEFWEHTRKNAPLILVATKIDKLPLSKRKPAMAALRKVIAGTEPGRRVIGFSAITGDGRADLWKEIEAAAR